MLTTNQIKSAAANQIKWCVENGDAPLFIDGVREGFEAGALWAENQLKPGIGLLQAENERLTAEMERRDATSEANIVAALDRAVDAEHRYVACFKENERLREAIKTAIKEAESEPDSNDGMFLALETLKKAIGK